MSATLNINAGLKLYDVWNDPEAGPFSKGLALTEQVMALVPVLAPSLVKKLQNLLQILCFPMGTEIATAAGSKPIEQLTEGDFVWSQDDQTSEIALRQVKRSFSNVASALVVLYCGTNKVEGTPEHPLWVVNQGWKPAGQVQAGDELWTLGKVSLPVTHIERKVGQFTVYNITVEGFHSYFVGSHQLLAHNADRCETFKQLLLTGDQARANLRQALGQIVGKVAHHVIPWELKVHPFVQKAAAGGFNLNGANNGFHISSDIHPGSHPNYNYTVWEEVDTLAKANPNISDSQAATLLQSLAEKLKVRINSGSLPID
jgi:hypothetical protein